MMCNFSQPLRSYKSYKNDKFNKYLAKARNICRAIDDLSLNEEDKKKLKKEIREIIK